MDNTARLEAVVATDPKTEPASYGLGRHGWISVRLDGRVSAARGTEIAEWVRTSYTLVAPTKLALRVIDEDRR